MVPAAVALSAVETSPDADSATVLPRAGILFMIVLACSLAAGILYSVQTALGALTELEGSGEDDETPVPASVLPADAAVLERSCWAGTLLLNLAAGLFSALLGISMLPGMWVAACIAGGLLAAVLQFAVFDIFVRQITLNHVEFVVRIFDSPARILTIPVRPLVTLTLGSSLKHADNESRLIAGLVHDRELRLLPHVQAVDTVMEEEAVEMIDSVREFFERTARDIMTPRTDLEGVPRNIGRQELFERLNETSYSRLLVYDQNLDSIAGFLLAKEVLLNLPGNPMDLLRKPAIVSTATNLPDLLILLRRERSYLAVVVDEYGGTAGIVTFHDLFEALIGEHIADEEEEEEFWIERKGPDEAVISGRVELWEINEQLDLDLDEKVARTLGGLLMHEFGRLPKESEEIDIDGGHFIVREVVNTRILAVAFRRNEQTGADAVAEAIPVEQREIS